MPRVSRVSELSHNSLEKVWDFYTRWHTCHLLRYAQALGAHTQTYITATVVLGFVVQRATHIGILVELRRIVRMSPIY